MANPVQEQNGAGQKQQEAANAQAIFEGTYYGTTGTTTVTMGGQTFIASAGGARIQRMGGQSGAPAPTPQTIGAQPSAAPPTPNVIVVPAAQQAQAANAVMEINQQLGAQYVNLTPAGITFANPEVEKAYAPLLENALKENGALFSLQNSSNGIKPMNVPKPTPPQNATVWHPAEVTYSRNGQQVAYTTDLGTVVMPGYDKQTIENLIKGNIFTGSSSYGQSTVSASNIFTGSSSYGQSTVSANQQLSDALNAYLAAYGMSGLDKNSTQAMAQPLTGPRAAAAMAGYGGNVALPKDYAVDLLPNLPLSFQLGSLLFGKKTASTPTLTEADILSGLNSLAQNGIGLSTAADADTQVWLGYNRMNYSYTASNSAKALAYGALTNPPSMAELLLRGSAAILPAAYVLSQKPSAAAGVGLYAAAYAVKDTTDIPLKPQSTFEFLGGLAALEAGGGVLRSVDIETVKIPVKNADEQIAAQNVVTLFGLRAGGKTYRLPIGVTYANGVESPTLSDILPKANDVSYPEVVASTRNLASYPQRPLENAFLTDTAVSRRLGITDIQAGNIEMAVEVADAYKGIMQAVRDQITGGTKNADEGAARIAIDTTKQDASSYGYGSYFAKQQLHPDVLNNPALAYTPGDIEISYGSKGQAMVMSQTINAAENIAGYKTSVPESGIGLDINGGKFLDIHSRDEPVYSYSGAPAQGYRYGLSENMGHIYLEGLETQAIGEQIVRMTGSSLGWQTAPALPIEPDLAKLAPEYLEIAEYVSKKGGVVSGGEALKALGFESTRHAPGAVSDLDIDISGQDAATKKEIVKGISDIVKKNAASRGGTDISIRVSEHTLFEENPKDIVGIFWDKSTRGVDIAFGEEIGKTFEKGGVRFISPEKVLSDKQEILAEHTQGGKILEAENENPRIREKVQKAEQDIPQLNELLGREKRVTVEPLGGGPRAKDVVKRYIYSKSAELYATEKGIFPENKQARLTAYNELLRNPARWETPEAKEMLTALDEAIRTKGEKNTLSQLMGQLDKDEVERDLSSSAGKGRPSPLQALQDLSESVSAGGSMASSSSSQRVRLPSLSSLASSPNRPSSASSWGSSGLKSASASLSRSVSSPASPASLSSSTSPASPSQSLPASPSMPSYPGSPSQPRSSPPSSPGISSPLSPSTSGSTSPGSRPPSAPPNPVFDLLYTSKKGSITQDEEEEKRKKKKSRRGYVAEVRRHGKFVTITPPVDLEQALYAGRSNALNTLTATFKVKAVAEEAVNSALPRIGKNQIGQGFREYEIHHGAKKETPNQFIQKRGTRLASQGERNEIQQAKKVSDIMGWRRKK